MSHKYSKKSNLKKYCKQQIIALLGKEIYNCKSRSMQTRMILGSAIIKNQTWFTIAFELNVAV